VWQPLVAGRSRGRAEIRRPFLAKSSRSTISFVIAGSVDPLAVGPVDVERLAAMLA
jgi:hypothetical protein